jgi:hypothetical protein
MVMTAREHTKDNGNIKTTGKMAVGGWKKCV